jgi:hypothetical protein
LSRFHFLMRSLYILALSDISNVPSVSYSCCSCYSCNSCVTYVARWPWSRSMIAITSFRVFSSLM